MDSLVEKIERAVEKKVVAAVDLMHIQYNVFTSLNCCRGIYEGIGVENPDIPNRAKAEVSKAERIGRDFGESLLLDMELMGEAGKHYLAHFLELFYPYALERVRMAEKVREKNRRKRLEEGEEPQAA